MAPQFILSARIDWEDVPQDSYVRDIPAIASCDAVDFSTGVTFLVGENGSGKSTFLEAVAVAWGLNPEGGTGGYRFNTFDSHSELHEAVHLVRSYRQPWTSFFLRAESFYNVATKAEEYARSGLSSPQDFWKRYGGRPLHEQSHGEAFLATVQGNFTENGLYFLDEPEAALSPSRQLTMLYEFDRLAAHGSQLIVATHSAILLGLPGARILSFDGGEVHEIAYEDTESYQITEMFVNRREQVLRNLLSE